MELKKSNVNDKLKTAPALVCRGRSRRNDAADLAFQELTETEWPLHGCYKLLLVHELVIPRGSQFISSIPAFLSP
jgi:hypothetical protein